MDNQVDDIIGTLRSTFHFSFDCSNFSDTANMVVINRFAIFMATISISLLDTSLARSLATKRQTTATDLEDLCSRRWSSSNRSPLR